MAEKPTRGEPATPAVAAPPSLVGRIGAVRDWSRAHPLRSVMIGGGVLAVCGLTLATWMYLATVAVSRGGPSIDEVLSRLDDGKLDEARELAMEMQRSGIPEEELGGPLFVLGAVRAAEAREVWSDQRRRSDFLIASRYLDTARQFGWPKDRQSQGLQLMGECLIESGKMDEGIEVLTQLLEDAHADGTRVHRILAAALSEVMPPRHATALSHLDAVLSDSELPSSDRDAVRLLRAEVLARMGQYDESLAELSSTSAAGQASPDADLVRGRTLLDRARSRVGSSGDLNDPNAIADFAEAKRLLEAIPPRHPLSPTAAYWVAMIDANRGNKEQALAKCAQLRQAATLPDVTLAATMLEAELLLDLGRVARSLVSLQSAIGLVGNTALYRHAILPLDELRLRMQRAHARILQAQDYDSGLKLAEQLEPVLGRTGQLRLRANTLQLWSQDLLSADPSLPGTAEKLRQGRELSRRAGMALEQLAERRFAEEEYTELMWNAAEAYFAGQSFSNTSRILSEFLKYEPIDKNAAALLRLGQAELAQGKADEAIRAFEECIELHGDDAASYRARLECADAYREQDRMGDAEQLLIENLSGAGLSPSSREWRDSLFALGQLYYEQGNYLSAIDRLEESIERAALPGQVLDDDHGLKARLAGYIVANCYREAAQKPLADYRAAQTDNERVQAMAAAQEYLGQSLAHYEEVQKAITLSATANDLDRAMLRNCYTMRGSVLFTLGRYDEAINAYSDAASLYQQDPFALDTYVQIANCQRRLGEPVKARGAIEQALLVLSRLPADADFSRTSYLTRDRWQSLLNEMKVW